MANRQRAILAESQITDGGGSQVEPHRSPERKFSILAPRPSIAPRFSLPSLTDTVPLNEEIVAAAAARYQSVSHIPPPLFVPGFSVPVLDGLPINQYDICNKQYSMQKPENEIRSQCSRRTVDDRWLTYTLEVLQGPQRARACGNGPRASSDRRPVDPPPVVQLKVFQTVDGTERDITMNYDSGFMLYASLEAARPIAQGRIQTPPHPPVLTGVAVASAAYLDRPNGPSGYFIFPDLSVRHEGFYRLKFSLFEAVKHAQDADHDRPFTHGNVDDRQTAHHASMANRMEVASEPFQVYSAKKFPGLNESTTVSKVLADQGCRVRIRRDVRQRKRVGEKKESDSTPQTPDVYSIPSHSRNQSMDSQYHDVRKISVESQYNRPHQSLQPSIGSMTQTSPTSHSAPRMPMGPPMHRPNYESLSSPINTSHPPVGSSLARASVLQRQPAPPPSANTHLAGAEPSPSQERPSQYMIPAAKSQKRSYGSGEINQTDPLKQGSRPDNVVLQPYQLPAFSDPIEADDVQDDDDDSIYEEAEFLKYRRAEGMTYSYKHFPRGLEALFTVDGTD